MNNEKISPYQLFAIMASFFLGSSFVINPSILAKQDAWLAALLACAIGMGFFLITAKIALFCPHQSLVAILTHCFGKTVGKLLGLVYAWYCIHLAAEVIRTYSDYTTTVTYPETPLLFFSICYTLVVLYALKAGLEVIGRLSSLFVFLGVFTILFTFAASIPSMEFNRLLPVLPKGFMPVLMPAFSAAILPYGEVVIFLMVFPKLNTQKYILKTVISVNLFVSIILFIILLRNLLVLGGDMASRDLYAFHIVYRLIPGLDVAPLLDINLVTAGVIKTSLALFCAARIITDVFSLPNYRIFLLPLAAFTVSLSMVVHETLLEQTSISLKMWPIYSFPFQVVLPIIILIICWMKQTTASR